MAISASLIAKSIAGTLALASPVATGVYYKENIYGFLNPEYKTNKKLSEILKEVKIAEQLQTKEGNNWVFNLTKDQLTKINFFNVSGDNTIETLGEQDKVKLKIEETKENFFKEGFKFIFISTKDVTIKKTENNTSNQITLKKDKEYEFRPKQTGSSYHLEEIFGIEKIKNDLKLNCDNENLECTIDTDQKINVKENDKKVEDVKFGDNSTNKKIKFKKYQEGFKGGFKFYVDENIELKKDGDTQTTIDPNTLSKDISYEALKEGDKWYLSKKIN